MKRLPLDWHERMYYRDQLRSARYAALADAEGFQSVCYALEALGMRVGKAARPWKVFATAPRTGDQVRDVERTCG